MCHDFIYIFKSFCNAVRRTDSRETKAAAGRPIGGLSPNLKQEVMVTVAMIVIETERSEKNVWT